MLVNKFSKFLTLSIINRLSGKDFFQVFELDDTSRLTCMFFCDFKKTQQHF